MVVVFAVMFVAVMMEKKRERNEAPLEKAIVNLDTKYQRNYVRR